MTAPIRFSILFSILGSLGLSQDQASTLARLTDRGRKIDRDALKVIARLERDLADRIGKRNLASLHRALEADWGAPAGAREGAAE